MAYVPGFQHDAFISYAHVNNVPLSEKEQGWVAAFHRELGILLAQKLGRSESFSIWRDPKISGNDEFEDAIDAAYRNSAVAVFVLSPGFVGSTWCCRELSRFSSQLDPGLEQRLAGKSRLFKVLHSHVEDEQVPAPLRKTAGYRFYQLDPLSGREERYRRTLESDEDQRYWTALDDLARDLADMLKRMRGISREQSEPAARPDPAAPVVYLAEVTDDLDPDREDLRRTLDQHGVAVLPDLPLPTDASRLEEVAREALAKADLSIHMLGPFYGRKPHGEARSYTCLQLDLAAGLAADRAGGERRLERFVWIPRGLDAAALRQEQRDLLAAVESEPPDVPVPAMVLKIGLEKFKEAVVEKLKELFPPPEPIVAETPGALIYLSCRPEDDPQAEAIRNLLRTARHDVILPIRNGDLAALERHYQTNLQNSDALLVLYASSPVLWVREELIKARRLSGGRRDFLMSVYNGPPATKEELGLDFHNLVVVDCRDGFQEERMRGLLARLGGRP